MNKLILVFVIFLSVSISAEVKRTSAIVSSDSRQNTLYTYSTSYDYENDLESYGGKYVKSWYTKNGSDAVSLLDLNKNNVPDFVEEITAFADSVINVYLSVGYKLPISDSLILYNSSNDYGGDSRFDLYFMNTEASSFLGVTIPLEQTVINKYNVQTTASFMLIDNDYKAADGKVSEILKLTITHELFHMFQNGYRAFTFADSYSRLHCFMELTAVSMEKRFFPDYPDYIKYVDKYYNIGKFSPFPSDFVSGNYANIDAYYGASIWAIYMNKIYGDNVLLSIWEDIGKGYEVSDALVDGFSKNGHDFYEFWKMFLKEILLRNFNMTNLSDSNLLPLVSVADTAENSISLSSSYCSGSFFFNKKKYVDKSNKYYIENVFNNNYLYFVSNFDLNFSESVDVSNSVFIDSKKFSIYPTILKKNQRTKMKFNFPVDHGQLYIFDINGRKVYEASICDDYFYFSTRFASGIYFVKFIYDETVYKSKILVLN